MSKLARTTLLVAMALPAVASAESYVVAPGEDVAAAIDALQPGDELVFAAGQHDLGDGLEVTLDGTAAASITLRGADGASLTSGGEATLRVSGSFVVIRDLELGGAQTGLALVGDNFTVHDNVFLENAVGLDCEDCDAVIIADNEFAGSTSAQDAALSSTVLTNSTVRGNWVHDTAGGGISLVARAINNIIVNNVVIATDGDGIVVEYPETLDDGAAGNLIVANFVNGAGGTGISTLGPVAIVNNIVAAAGTDGIATTATEFAIAEPIEVIHNTVVDAGFCFRATAWSLSQSANVVTNNAFYCDGGDAFRFDEGVGMFSVVGRNIFLGNADFPGDSVLGGSAATDFAMADAADFYPAPGSPLIDAGEELGVSADFNGTPRDAMPDIGAYEVTTDLNPADVPDGFKTEPDDGTGSDDPDDDDGGGGGGDGGGGGSSGSASGGAEGFPERTPDGCGCSSSAGSAPWAPMLLLFGFFGLRRRR